MSYENIPDDLYNQIKYVVNDELKYYKTYSAKVKSVSTDSDTKGFIQVWSNQINPSDETDSSSWLPVRPANIFYSQYPPDKGDYVLVRYFNGDPSIMIYDTLDAIYYKPKKSGENNKVLFEYQKETSDKLAAISYDTSKKMFTHEVGDSKITIDKDDIKIENNDVKIEYNKDRIKLKRGSYYIDINASGIFVSNGSITYELVAHTHITTVTGFDTVTPTPKPNTGA